ncbi:MAG: CoA-binding protein [Candidatus Micrarchaeota archaeon]
MRAYSSKGHKVFPINPNEQKIEGLECYRTVLDVPNTIDIALL